ncbi:MAG: DNA topoisomerase IV subunit A [Alphaproteobacteria bacterium]|nr:DNA topoisomerase IV subunit A [Alphaproteobacteria bacterium]MBN2675420.1 DNA topoisomerase IV subunit A [Alphaproteobacteria bacterium]
MKNTGVINENIDKQQLADALSERYLSYAVSTIVSRALPDVRDGLKPVHRRILYAMLRKKLTPNAAFRKCAAVVGDVLGQYHPHGDSSVYDAMVRLAQDFSVRYPLIDGQGNFGNIDGDPQAAYRYTESKMTEASMLIMEGLDENSVDMMPNFDGTTVEPVVMPGAFPNLLANGGMGIAVGMATNIPTHNVSEVCDALALVIDKPDATTVQIMKKMVGPDFPTGGTLIDDFDTIVKNYETGRGAFRIRAKWEIEKLDRGLEQAVITEIPYGVVKSRLVEQIANLIDAKKLPLVDDIIDESTTDVRMVIIPKSRNVPIDKMMAHLFAMTDLESRFNMNFNVIDSLGSPRVMKIGEVLNEFIAHQKVVLRRRTEWRLGNIERRLEVLGGLLVVYLNLDRVIEIIRNEDEAKSLLMEEFKLTDVQVEAILNTRLRSLRKLEEMEIRREDKELHAEQKKLKSLLADDNAQNDQLKAWFADIKKTYDKKTTLGRRRTIWDQQTEEIVVNAEEFIEKEPMTIILSTMGWIRAAKGHLDLDSLDLKFKEGDELFTALHAQSTDKINLFVSSGKMFSLAANELPSARGFGESIRMMADIDADESIVRAFVLDSKMKYLLVAKHGTGFIVSGENCLAQTKNGKQVMNIDKKTPAVLCVDVTGEFIALSGSNDKILVFNTSDIPEMARGKGVILQKYNAERTYILDAMFFNSDDGFSWTNGRGTTKLDDWQPWVGKRATQGRTIPVGFPRNGKFGK